MKTRTAGPAAMVAIFAAMCATPGNGFAQAPAQGAPHPTVMLVEPPGPLLPKQFGAWQQQAAADPNASAPAIDPTLQTIFKEDGIARAAASTYARGGSAETVSLKAYQFIDATGAFSAFTYLRGPEYRAVANLGTSAVERGDTVLIWNGPTVVQAEFHGGRRETELTDLVSTLPKVGGPKGDPPLLPTFLPAKGLESETVKYALGPESYTAMGGVLPNAIAGFDKSAEAVTAKYAGRGTLTLLLYPTPTIAGDHGRQIEAEMNHEGAAAGTVKLRREGELVLLTTGAWPAAEAQQLVDNIHLRTELTWNKPIPPEFHVEIRKTASLLFSIIGLSLALMVAAIVLGLFFGGLRAMIRVLQGKPAAAEPEFLHLDLREGPGERGSFKPLH